MTPELHQLKTKENNFLEMQFAIVVKHNAVSLFMDLFYNKMLIYLRKSIPVHIRNLHFRKNLLIYGLCSFEDLTYTISLVKQLFPCFI